MNTKFVKLYQASKDGASAIVFHSKCDHKGPTLTIVQAESGMIFGGYLDFSIESPDFAYKLKKLSRSFIFSNLNEVIKKFQYISNVLYHTEFMFNKDVLIEFTNAFKIK